MFNRFIYRREWVFAFIVKRFRVFVRRFNDECTPLKLASTAVCCQFRAEPDALNLLSMLTLVVRVLFPRVGRAHARGVAGRGPGQARRAVLSPPA
ncbi:hypothetical protein ABLN67_09485 [Mycobacterium tuberculosis]